MKQIWTAFSSLDAEGDAAMQTETQRALSQLPSESLQKTLLDFNLKPTCMGCTMNQSL